MTEAKATSLAKKLAAIMGDLPAIERTGRNEHFGYDYIEEEAVSRELRGRLAKAHVIVIPSVTGHERVGTLTVLTIALTFIDGESGEQIVQGVVGYGADTQDKGASKALTSGVKYGLLKAFLIPGAEDPDKAAPLAQPPQAPRPQAPTAPQAPRPQAPPPRAPQAAPKAPAADKPVQEAVIYVAGITQKSGGPADKPWTKYTVLDSEGQKYGTFSKSAADAAKRAKEGGLAVLVHFTTYKAGMNDLEREGGLEIMGEADGSASEEIPFG